MSKILDAEEKYFKVAYGKAEKEALEEMAHGSEQANNIVRDLAEDYGLDKYIVQTKDPQRPLAAVQPLEGTEYLQYR